MLEKVVWLPRAGFRKRGYPTYEEYLAHQVAKLVTIKGLGSYHEQFRDVLGTRLATLPLVRGTTVLCLGARTGAECQAFIDKGCVAIGIDLNPGEKNKYVVAGDFHKIQYPDASFDVVFTNALDHVFELDRVLEELRRVLKPSGLFVAEIVRGSKDDGGREPGEYEALWWDSIEQPIQAITNASFVVWERVRFDWPWGGDHVVFKRF